MWPRLSCHPDEAAKASDGRGRPTRGVARPWSLSLSIYAAGSHKSQLLTCPDVTNAIHFSSCYTYWRGKLSLAATKGLQRRSRSRATKCISALSRKITKLTTWDTTYPTVTPASVICQTVVWPFMSSLSCSILPFPRTHTSRTMNLCPI